MNLSFNVFFHVFVSIYSLSVLFDPVHLKPQSVPGPCSGFFLNALTVSLRGSHTLPPGPLAAQLPDRSGAEQRTETGGPQLLRLSPGNPELDFRSGAAQ